MPRKRVERSLLDRDGTLAWWVVAALLGLDEEQCRRLGRQALDKLRTALEAEGIDAQTAASYLHDRNREDPRSAEYYAALLLMQEEALARQARREANP